MKATILSTLIAAAFTLTASAESPKPAVPAGAPKSVAKVDDLTSYTTADSLWVHIQELQKEPDVQPKSREEMIELVKNWFTNQRAAAQAFVATYPKDTRRWQAKLIALQSSFQLSQVPGADAATQADAEKVLKEVDTIVASEEAPEEVRGEASFIRVMASVEAVDPEKAETAAEFFKRADAFLGKFGTHKFAPQVKQTQIQLASQVDTPEAEEVLKRHAASKEEHFSEMAQQAIVQKQKAKDLKSKPVELKFTATDGKEVDLAKLRGKVVLVDFWASWCGPCIGEMPNVVATYKKLHDKGFEILGISLDQEKKAMEEAVKTHEMTWPQFFDGKGWQNSISSSFGIRSIPAAWLIDKKGMLRSTDLRGEALTAGVEKLLAE